LVCFGLFWFVLFVLFCFVCLFVYTCLNPLSET
jgi:hypothetical protein